MSGSKKGFVVYFNNYPMMSNLSYEQQGMLFSILMIYADRVWRDLSVPLEEVMEGFPKLLPETRMACGFMGAAIQRDTKAWLSKVEYRVKKRQDPAPTAAELDKRAREDMERTQRLMEQMKEDPCVQPPVCP